MITPSPNEMERFTKEESIKRRQIRLRQVREQEKIIASRIRNAVKNRYKKEICELTETFKAEWVAKQRELVAETEQKYTEGLKQVGYSHMQAKQNAPNQALQDAILQDRTNMAEMRGKIALKNQQIIVAEQKEPALQRLKNIRRAQIKEKMRAKHISLLPTKENEVDSLFVNDSDATSSSIAVSNSGEARGRFVTVHEKSSTTISTGLPDDDGVVERAEICADAREQAAVEEERINLLQAEKDRSVQERLEKAKVRHQAALQKARLDQVGKTFMDELKVLKKKDAIKRQNNIYKPEALKRKQFAADLFPQNVCDKNVPETLIFGRREVPIESENTGTGSLGTDTDSQSNMMSFPSVSSVYLDLPDSKQKPNYAESRIPKQQNALSKLLKQIETQREAKKTDSQSTVTESSENYETPDEQKTSSKDILKPNKNLKNNSIENNEQNSLSPTITITSSEASEMPVHQSFNSEAQNSDSLNSDGTKSWSKFNSHEPNSSSLEETATKLKNDPALLKSVEDFQTRILMQHKSHDKIQQQIKLLELKKNNLNNLVSAVTNPKTY